ncbi:MAG TPA: hypothetical protein VFR63_09845 [Gaiellaceae bacterium]|nr:hypothetical protein [Gaiellaceae bacterium]
MTGLVDGSCYGFQPVSDLAFEYLRGGGGEALAVAEEQEATGENGDGVLVTEWTPIPGRRLWARLYADGSGYRLWVEGYGSFAVDPHAPSVRLPAGAASAVRREERLWGIPAMLCFVARGDLPLHAAAVDVGGEAVLLAAPGYFGKTTLAAGFDVAGHRVLSEDVSCIRFLPEPSVVPGPAMLRVREDVADHLVLPRAEAVASSDNRVHFSLDPDRRGDSTAVPLRAVVLLRGADDEITLDRVPAAEALRDLWPLSFRLPTHADRERCFHGIAQLAASVRLWNLRRPMRLDELGRVVERIVADA